MADISGLQGLRNLVNASTGNRGGKQDNKITLGEVRRFIDTNNNGKIDPEEIGAGSLVDKMAKVDLNAMTGLNQREREQLQKAQELLKKVIEQRLIPPKNVKTEGIEDDPLIRDPHELSCPQAMQRWSDMRSGFRGQTVRIDVQKAKQDIDNILRSNGGDVKNLVKQLWENDDSVGGTKTNTIRMEELIGAFAKSKDDPAFQEKFIKEMTAYINDPSNGMDPQFVLDSLLQVIQSTNFEGQEGLEKFLKDLAIGVAKDSPALAGKTGVVGNYDGTREGGIFGSLALVKKADGTFEFIEHDPSDKTNKTRYQLDNDTTGSSSGTAGVTPGNTAGTALIDPKRLQRDLNSIQGALDDKDDSGKSFEDKIRSSGNAADNDAFTKATNGLKGINIPSVIKSVDTSALQSLIGNLRTLHGLAIKYKDTDLASELESLIKNLEGHLKDLQGRNNAGISPGRPTPSTPVAPPAAAPPAAPPAPPAAPPAPPAAPPAPPAAPPAPPAAPPPAPPVARPPAAPPASRDVAALIKREVKRLRTEGDGLSPEVNAALRDFENQGIGEQGLTRVAERLTKIAQDDLKKNSNQRTLSSADRGNIVRFANRLRILAEEARVNREQAETTRQIESLQSRQQEQIRQRQEIDRRLREALQQDGIEP